MNYLKNIFLGATIGAVLGLFFGTLFEYKVTKQSKWEEKQQMQQIIFSFIGCIGGAILGVKIAEEENDK